MQIIITSTGANLDAPISPVFGRCPMYILVDTETLAFEAQPNPAIGASGGAGIQAAQYVIEQGAQAVLTGNVGPNAFDVFQAADIPIYLVREGTVRQAVAAFNAGQLASSAQANVAAHAGLRGPARTSQRQQEIAALQDTARDLRQQLAEVMTRIDKLEKES
ncbi:MAG: dinitrogenase iron-molybdenum cofactor biosynthesis protein [Chloroflexi bacterium]|nr:dinitrogenase iron-molybdenum cofactor biosynthesis protein [Chloroflexota bacterium]MBU1752090.1 dinitrogenase iron-molybdenum cofactor biosynthesis protein [Chloroflexota bacterium]